MKDMSFIQIFKGSLIASLLILAIGVNQEDVLDLMFGKPGQEITVVMMTDTLPQENTADESANPGDHDLQDEKKDEAVHDFFGPWQPRRWNGHGNESGSMK